MSTFVVQQPVAIAEVGALDAAVTAVQDAAVAMSAHGWPIAVLSSAYVPAQQICLSLIDAEDAATVMEMLRRAGSRSATVLPTLEPFLSSTIEE